MTDLDPLYDLPPLGDDDGPPDDGSEDEYFPPPSNPMAVARRLLPHWHHTDGASKLRYWRGTWMRWEGACWAGVDDQDIRSTLYLRLERAEYLFTTPKGEEEAKPWAPSKRKIADLLDALGGITHLSATVDPPAWIDRSVAPPGPFVACANGLLHVPTRTRTDHEPGFFNLVSVPFDFDPSAPEPKRWLEFLGQIWPDDPSVVDLLQEYFGYVISGRTDMQKIVMIVGPTRSGKGTIARVLTALVGKGNVAGPTLASLGTNFGLSPLLGKPLAIVSDARLDPRSGQQVVESLLRISGEDMIDVDRKYKDPWSGRLPTRFVILSNELPKFGDDSGVIADRFFVVAMNSSFLGREDPGLTDALLGELPGILNWALDGLARLDARGRFIEPEGSSDARQSMRDMASPTSAFVRELCVKGRDHSISVDELWATWKQWCDDNGQRTGSKQMLSRNLAAAAPGVAVYRPHGEPRRYRGIRLSTPYETNNGGTSGSTGSPGSATGPAEPREPVEPLTLSSPIQSEPARPRSDWGPCAGCSRHVLQPASGEARCPQCRTGS